MERIIKKISLILMVLFSLLIAVIFSGCSSGSSVVTIDRLSFNKATTNLEVGGSEILSVDMGTVSSVVTYVLSSNNEAVASIDQDGLVTANSVGVATISVTLKVTSTVKASKITATCVVYVTPVESQLSTPSNLRFDGEKVVWDSVSDNSGYKIWLNGELQSTITSNNYFRNFEVGISNTITVQALGDNYETSDSLVSNEFVFLQLNTPTMIVESGRLRFTNTSEGQLFQVLMDNSIVATNVSDDYYIIPSTVLSGRHEFKIKALGVNENEYASGYSNSFTITKLSAPTNATVVDKVLTFDSVVGASTYNIKIIDNTTNVTTYEEVTTSSFTLNETYTAGKYSIYLQAKGDNTLYLDSAYSTSVASDKLSAPTNLEIENGVISWDSVEHASGYKLTINLLESETTQNLPACSFDFASSYTTSGNYTISVIATGETMDNARYLNSNSSDSITVTKLKSPQNAQVINGVLVWDSVELASSYQVMIGDSETLPITINNYYSFANTNEITYSARSYTIRVKAMGNNADVLDSSYSGSCNFEKIGTVVDNGFSISGDTIIWESVENALTYEVYLNNSTTAVIVTGNTLQMSDNSYESGGYTIRVRAISTASGFISGEKSNSFSFTKLPSPVEVEIVDGYLSWSMPENSGVVTYYNVMIGTTVYTGLTATTTNLDGYMLGGATALICIQAVGDEEEYLSSNFSSQQSFTKLSSQLNLNVNSGALTWGEIVGASSYEILVARTLPDETIYTQTIEVMADEAKLLDLMNDVRFTEAGYYSIQIKAIGGTGGVYISSALSSAWELTKLANISNLRVEGGYIRWDSVTSVSFYEVFVDGVSLGSCGTITTYSLNSNYIAGNHTFMVFARGNQSTILNAVELDNTMELTKLANDFSISVNQSAVVWNTISHAFSYSIEIRDSNNSIVVATGGILSTIYTFQGLSGGQSYSLRVRANGDSTQYINGDFSANSGNTYFEAKILAIPTNVAVEDGLLYFDYVDNCSSYLVSIIGNDSRYSYYVTRVDGTNRGYYDFANFVLYRASGSYSITVRAIGGIGTEAYISSDLSNSVVCTKLTQPTISVSNGKLVWSIIENNESYEIIITNSTSDSTSVELTSLTNVYELSSAYSSGTYTVNVIAHGNGADTIDSSYSSNLEVEKLDTPKSSTDDLRLSSGSLVWNTILHASQYSIYVYQRSELNETYSLKYSTTVMPATINSYLPYGDTGVYKITIKVIGDSTKYLNSNVYEYTNVLTKLNAPTDLHVIDGAFAWSQILNETANGYQLSINNNLVNVGGVDYFELGDGYSAINYTVAIRSLGNSVSILSSDLSSTFQALKLSEIKPVVNNGNLSWLTSGLNNYTLQVINLLTSEVTDIDEFTSLTYSLNDLSEGVYTFSIKSLGTTLSYTSGALLNSNYSTEINVYKLETPDNFNLLSNFEATDVEEISTLGMLTWSIPNYSNAYNLTINQSFSLYNINGISTNVYDLTDYDLRVGEYYLNIIAQNLSTINIEGLTYYVINSDSKSLTATKLPSPTDLYCENGNIYWTQSAVSSSSTVEPRFLVYYKFANEGSEFDISTYTPLLSNEECEYSMWDLGQYKFKVVAVGENCIRSDVAEFDGTYLFDLFSQGRGTSESPYLIQTFTKSGVVRTALSQFEILNYMSNKHYILCEDITLTSDFGTIGTKTDTKRKMFNGTIDGQYNSVQHTIYAPSVIYNSSGTFGLFKSLLENAVVENLNISNFAVGGTYNIVGIVAGESFGTISNVNVYSANSINSSYSVGSQMYVGGIVGINRSGAIIQNCQSTITINATNLSNIIYAGGIVGYNEGEVSGCTFNAIKISGEAINDQITGTIVGGIVGFNSGINASVSKCVNYASIYATSFAGTNGSASANAGGIVGKNSAIVDNQVQAGEYPMVIGCVNNGCVEAFDPTNESLSARVGGLIGYTTGGGVEFSVNYGKSQVVTAISGATRYYSTALSGGLIGWNDSETTVTNTLFYEYSSDENSVYNVQAVPDNCLTEFEVSDMTATTLAEFNSSILLAELNSASIGIIFELVDGLPQLIIG
ncbi:MAG: Ig-like domain-containing protein [Bacilli bacterium]